MLLCTTLVLASCARAPGGMGGAAPQAGPPAGVGPITPTQPIQLFNGRDLTGFYTWLADFGYQDPHRVFTVVDRIDGAPAIRVSGQDWGGLITRDTYANYRLIVEFRWGDVTWGTRVDKTRDSGILYHAQGPEGAAQADFKSPWMRSLEYQLIEGGTGDLIIIAGFRRDGQRDSVSLMTTVRRDRDGERVWDPRGQPERVVSGRVNWWGRDVDWADRFGYRGRADVEYPVGQWNVAEVITRGRDVTHILNGHVVFEGKDADPSQGKIFIQSEAAEMYVRKIELRPL